MASDTLRPAPTKVPAFFSNKKVPEFVRANIALAYARSLSNRRIHEEALATLALFHPEQVHDPASYLFHRAVCEHALLKKDLASRTINRSLSNRRMFASNFIMLAMTTMLIITVVKSSLALSLGLVGALSIVHSRMGAIGSLRISSPV